MPAFMNCSESPEPGCTQNTTVSVTPATSVSDWPTPTVSISTRSNRARITTMAASVWSATTPEGTWPDQRIIAGTRMLP